ncbi:glycosyltransferase family 4 protein [Pontibacter ruber]|uniref:Glycosyltransferase family 4 protein n=1 Tax=Pontibacter ruber TaxID=1343895 RepID=A0ABW5CY20_9BACT|nr:glycosyltransferase family 4 protein [Pontibacter ruber]
MRVLHLVSEKTWRGGEQQVAYLIEELLKQGVQCFVACRRRTPFHDYCLRQNIPHVALAFANEFDFGTAWQVKKYAEQQQVDVVHVHSAHAHAISIWAYILGNHRPIILSRRVDFPVKQNFLSQFKYNHPGIARVVCVSDKIKEVVSQSLKQPEKCVTVYSGVDMSRFAHSRNTGKLHREFTLPLHLPIIGNVSAIAPHKDYFTFVDTVELLVQQHLQAQFFIIGDGPEREQVQAYVQQKQLQNHITFTGFRNDIPEILPELDVMLITSETEGLGTTILDAFACQVPVVATQAGGIPEIVKDGHTGLLAPVKRPDLLAQKVIQILRDAPLRERLVKKAANLAQQFSKENTALHTLQVYQEVTNGR